MVDNLGITAIFTISAIARGYLWRRFFNKGLHKKVHKWIAYVYRFRFIRN
jgi:hypothetical protein